LAVWARTDDPEPLVGTLVVDADVGDYHVERTWDHLGMRATRSDDVVSDGTVVPPEHAVAVAPVGTLTIEARDP
jgi:alkylation response protein AidB-like acyl-CoA dehydrogenase